MGTATICLSRRQRTVTTLPLSKEGESFSRRAGEQRKHEKERRWLAAASLEEGKGSHPLPLEKETREENTRTRKNARQVGHPLPL